MLVVGGGKDFSLTEVSLRRVAIFHRTSLEMLPGAPHDLMLTHTTSLAEILDDFAAGSHRLAM